MQPIGSIVYLKEGTSKNMILNRGPIIEMEMIYGRKQVQAEKKVTWDYVACTYPQGHLILKKDGEKNR